MKKQLLFALLSITATCTLANASTAQVVKSSLIFEEIKGIAAVEVNTLFH